MEDMQMSLSTKALVITSGVLWGSAVLTVGLVNLANPRYGRRFLKVIGSVYPGYRAKPTAKDVAVGTTYALVDGAIAGAVFGLVYNQFAEEREEAEELKAA
jgi:hypothetical protein